MDFWDRILWLAIGCFIGFVLGYIVRSLHYIKETVDHVDEIVVNEAETKPKHVRGDNGFMRHPIAADLAIFLVVGLTVWAALSTSKVNAELQRTLECITNYNVRQSQALEFRDNAVKAGTQLEIDLWSGYVKLYKVAKKDPSKIPDLQDQLNNYIKDYRDSLIELQETRDDFPYANPDVLQNCSEEN